MCRTGRWFGWALIGHGIALSLAWIGLEISMLIELVAVVFCAVGLFAAAFAARRLVTRLAMLLALVGGIGDVAVFICALMAENNVDLWVCWPIHLYAMSATAFLMMVHTAGILLFGRERRVACWPLALPLAFVALWLPLWAELQVITLSPSRLAAASMLLLIVLVFATGMLSLMNRHRILLSGPEWWLDRSRLPSRDLAALTMFPDAGSRVHLPNGSVLDFAEGAAAFEWLRDHDYTPKHSLDPAEPVAQGSRASEV